MELSLSLLERRLLMALPSDGTPREAGDVAASAGLGSAGEALRAAGSPQRHGLVDVEEESRTQWSLSEEGLRHRGQGLPERRAIAAIHGAGGRLPMAALATEAALEPSEVKVAVGWLKRKGWADIQQGMLVATGPPPEAGPDEQALERLGGGGEGSDGAGVDDGGAVHEGLALLRQRGGVLVEKETTVRRLRLTEAGIQLVRSLPAETGGREVNQVTPALLAEWEAMSAEDRAAVQLRPFDFGVPVAPRLPGKPHPLTQIMAQIRQIFWRMGFQEISGDYVESVFWNMDALFIPQDHPAREMQDTFYLDEPAALAVQEEDLARGKAVHEHGGGTGSTGWGGTFDPAMAQRALLRTHTTNTTIRYLAQNPRGVHRIFGLGRVFRNETMDATHLPEFHQIEGIVTEPGADFDMLIGLCRHFFGAIGFPDVRFRPAYFPYTEPSMEIEVKMDGRWVELGGCGVFRPEVTEPLGVEHPVLAWGFGLERLALRATGLKDIRHLYISDVQWLREQPLV